MVGRDPGRVHSGSAVRDFTGKDETEILQAILRWIEKEMEERSIYPTIFSISFRQPREQEEIAEAYVAYE